MIAFVIVGLAAIAAAIGVVTARNAVHSVLWLIAHLCSLAVLYLTLQATFLGLVQVLLYAGAVMVLFLFVLGLLSTRGETEDEGTPQPRGLAGSAVVAAIVMAALLLVGAAAGEVVRSGALPSDFGSVAAFGTALFGRYLLPFEATALALLIAVVGVVAIGQEPSKGLPTEAEVVEDGAIDVSHAQSGSVGVGGERR